MKLNMRGNVRTT